MNEIQFKEKVREYALEGKSPRELINSVSEVELPHKRAWYWLGKWSDRGQYSYGVTLDLGWLIEKGKYGEHIVWKDVKNGN